MINIIKVIISLIWAVVVLGLGVLLYNVYSLDMGIYARWGWVIITLVIFLSITLVAYNVVFSKPKK